MKKMILGLVLVFTGTLARAVNGLEGIVVEKYYVSNAADSIGSVGLLPVGSVTYRIYADMLPGYKFSAVYGVPGHELRISTQTSFFNNEDRGDVFPTYTKPQAANNTVMLDSWLSVGAACDGNFGVMKTEDDGVANVVNANGILANNDPSAGIPLTVQDGLLAGTPDVPVTIGLTPAMLSIFNNVSRAGSLLSTFNGSWASLAGTTGPTASNRVLIAQLTTDGVLQFELNVQIKKPGGGLENYVAKNPVGNEISIPSLTYRSSTGIPTMSEIGLISVSVLMLSLGMFYIKSKVS